MISKAQVKREQRIHRHNRVRARVSGTEDRPRLAVFKSNTSLSAQLIDDVNGKTLASTSTASQQGSSSERVVAAAKALTTKAKEAGVKQVVFDRGGFQYIGVIKAFADAAREEGLEF